MKKFMFFLLSLTLIIGIITLEGGSVTTYAQISAALLITLGVLFSALFSYSFKEIIDTFKDSFSEKTIPTYSNRYKRGQTIAKAMSKLSICWGLLGVFLGIVYTLSRISTPAQLGVGLAMTLISAFYGVLYTSILFIPMGNSLGKKFEDANAQGK